MSSRRWFITGGTPGNFGMAFAEAALQAGDVVTVTSRRPQELAGWADQYGDRVLVVPLELTDPTEVRAAVHAAEERFGGIDVLVNNAGRGWYGSIEAMDESSMRAMFELNFFAVLSVTRAVLPGMRARGDGWIVNVSSVAGLVSAPGFGYYSATKYAIEAVTDALRDEVAPQGISVLTVEPGAFRTNAYSGFAEEPVSERIPVYHDILEQVRATFVAMDGTQPGDPHRGARAVIEAMAQNPPPRRLVLGNSGYDAVVDAFGHTLADIRANETLSRSADFPT
ncbi:SDR family NAD(P)-dependent oxidoreductase [Mycobacterium yunnanensis]|uniref:SDR family NAD(P)-dependent oxidoreductase n=1 Tax=Mycobacterium yunnanensis TaxID=368477 RepID=A0A9X2Z1M2_9MYCO|nr:SDR family NAD(P)-dependent oxidoreductase [Mycobacterium yunnanensis]MCV7420482.1 SDR family NAD(P)-dependent oxidoreductase [Mycobacterium yunnanensis]